MAPYLFIATIVLGWSLISALLCLSLCVMSSRFSAQLERHEREQQAAQAASVTAWRRSRAMTVRATADATPRPTPAAAKR